MVATGKRRAYGQHFLRDKSVITKIADTALELAARHGCESLLEVGPGKGAITEPILERLPSTKIKSFTLVERDRDLAAEWKGKAQAPRPFEFKVECADFMDLANEHWLTSAPLAVVSNLPYSAGTAILLKLAENKAQIPCMTLMFQAEVARRLRAKSGEKAWGSLSLWIQNDWDVERLLHVPPGAFAPPPDVDSEVVTLIRREKPRIDVDVVPGGRARWESLLKIAFAHRRKMLRSGIPASSPHRKALDASGVDGTKRAEALSWEEWERLFSSH